MDVILLERIRKLGQMGEVVRVKTGFARNYLLPQGKALRATKDNIKQFEAEKSQIEARSLDAKKEAEQVSEKLAGESFVLIRQAGEAGQLYGSVSTRDIATAVTEAGFSIERTQVVLDRPIKSLGLVDIIVSLHPEVETPIVVNVARSQEEAERQARGEDVTQDDDDDAFDADEAITTEEVFEDEDQAHEVEEEMSDEIEAVVDVMTGEEAPGEDSGEQNTGAAEEPEKDA